MTSGYVTGGEGWGGTQKTQVEKDLFVMGSEGRELYLFMVSVASWHCP
jgi:hypothetical protein